MALTKAEVLAAVAARKLETKTVEVPEWGGDVCIRRVSPAELEAIGFFSGMKPGTLPVRLLHIALATDKGEPMFSKQDLEALAAADFATIIRVFEEAAKFNGLNDEDVEEAAEGFADAQDGPSSSS